MNERIKAGDRVRIKKGTLIRNPFYSGRPKVYEAGKTYTVKVNHVLTGYSNVPGHKDQPTTVRWAGPGGYWLEAEERDVEVVEG